MRRYMLTLTKVPYEARDEFRRLSRPETYVEVKRGEVGERVSYSVWMTPKEHERALRVLADPKSNLVAVDRDADSPPPAVPDTETLSFMSSTGLARATGGGRGVVVALLDTGVSRAVVDSHFAGRIEATYSVDGLDPYNDVSPDDGHGSFSAGLCMPPRARLAIGQVYDAEAGGSASRTAAGVNWAIGIGADVIVAVVQNDAATGLKDAVDDAAAKGIIVVAAMGNGGPDFAGGGENYRRYPAAYDGVLGITNYDWRTGRIASTSNYGTWASFAAPGKAVSSYHKDGSVFRKEDGGTSAATPAAGYVVANLLGDGRSPGNVRAYLARHARDTAPATKEGHGVVQGGPAAQQRKDDRPYRRNLQGKYLDKRGNPLEGTLVDRNTGQPLPGGKYAGRADPLVDPTAPIYGGRRPGQLVDSSGNKLPTQPACEV